MRRIVILAGTAIAVAAAFAIVIFDERPLTAVVTLAVGAACALAWRSLTSGAGASGQRGGVIAVPPRLLSGAIGPEDWPAAAWFDRREGAVTLRLIVARDGMPRDVEVALSSGVADLDQRSCEVVAARFRYAPARDRHGAAIEAPAEERIAWSLASLDLAGDPGEGGEDEVFRLGSASGPVAEAG